MRPIIRPALAHDVAAGIDCVKDWAYYNDSQKQRIVHMAKMTLARRDAIATCVDDLDDTFNRRTVAFAIGAFVRPALADEIRLGMHPFVGTRMLELWEAGKRPFLSRGEVAKANVESRAHFLTLFSGAPRSLMFLPEFLPILNLNSKFVYDNLSGYRLNEMFVETFGHEERDFTSGMGYNLGPSLAPALRVLGMNPPEKSFPYIQYATSSDAFSVRGTLHSAVFLYRSPKLQLNVNEQELLSFAVCGFSDEELTKLMLISFSTVRKRWNAIYGKFRDRLPSILNDGDSSKPSGEKRRRVIQYIDFHREELRPHPAPQKTD